MTALICWFLRNRVAANLLMVVLLAAGAAAITSVTVRSFPEIAATAVTVSVSYPGANPGEVADSVLSPIEQQLEGIGGVREIRSTAARGMATLTAELVEGADASEVESDIEAAIARITSLPDAAEAPRISIFEPQEMAVQIVIYGNIPRMALKHLAVRVRDDLTELDGVSQVALAGLPDDQVDITVGLDTLRSYGLGVLELAGVISSQNAEISAGRIDTGTADIQVRTTGAADAVSEYRSLRLFSDANGAAVQLDDIAEVKEGLASTSERATISGEPAVFVSVNRADSEQMLAVADAVQTYLDDKLRPSLPNGAEVQVWRDQAEILQGRVNLLAKNGALGAVLILAVLALVLDLRIAAWVAFGVVVAFAGAFAPMLLFGPSINQLSLFGFILALGIVVDDAIIVGERTFGEVQKGPVEGAAERGILRVWRPILFSVLTTIIAFLALWFLPGESGSFVSPVAAVVIYVLSASLIESFFILPNHLSHVGAGAPGRFSPRRFTEPVRGRINRGLDRFAGGPLRTIVRGSIRHPVFVIVASIAIGIGTAGCVAGGLVKFVFFPEIEGNFVTAELEFPRGTSESDTLESAQRFVEAAETAAAGLGEEGLLQGTAVRVGFADISVSPLAENSQTGSTASIQVKLLDADVRQTSAADFRREWSQAVGEIPGARNVAYSSTIVGIGAPILFEVSAESEAARNAAVARLRESLEGRDGVSDIRDGRFSSAQEIALSATGAANTYGVTVESLARNVRAALYGAQVDQIARDREEVDVRLRLPEEQRNSVADLLDLWVPAGSGQERTLLPLGVLADLNFRPAPVTIERIDGRTVTTISADVDTGVTTGGGETDRVLEEIVPDLIEDYPGLEVQPGGEQEEAGRFTGALAVNFLLALLAIYVVLALAFSSYLRPFIVLLLIPFGLIGAILGHLLLGLDLTILSMFGIVGLAGVMVNDSLLIVNYIQSEKAEGTPALEAVEEATINRFRPVMLTTVTTFLGITPLVLEQSVQAQFLIPTAVSLGFGVLFASVLQMVLVPAYATLYERLSGDESSSARSANAR